MNVDSPPTTRRRLRRDFFDGDCHFCSKDLTTGIATFVGDGSSEVPAGPTCAEKKAPEFAPDWIDLTGGAMVLKAGRVAERGEASEDGEPGPVDRETERRLAMAYVLLRQDRLGDWKWAFYSKLQPTLEAIRRGTFGAAHVASALSISRWAGENAPSLTLPHLQACYAARRLIERCICRVREEGGDTRYLENRLKDLRWKRYIPSEFIEGTNNWIGRRWPRLRLRTGTFAAVEEVDPRRPKPDPAVEPGP